MADPTNASQWEGADVYIADVGTDGPTDLTSPWPAGWSAIGLLDGGEGFTEGRENESTEKYAWGGILVRKTKSRHKRTIRFVALEDNPNTFRLVNPGSTRTSVGGVATKIVKVPSKDQFAIGFELRDGSKIKRRTVKRAEVEEIGEIKDSEEDTTMYEITVVIYPEADRTLYTDLETDEETAP